MIIYALCVLYALGRFVLCAGVVADVRGDDKALIYVDGQNVVNTTNWAEVWSGLIPTSTRVVAVHVRNLEARGFLVASFSNGFKTSEEWRCSRADADGWTNVDFDDSEWSTAVKMTDSPALIDTDPFWGGAAVVWTNADGRGRNVYCRAMVG